jgi:hypothetical protein
MLDLLFGKIKLYEVQVIWSTLLVPRFLSTKQLYKEITKHVSLSFPKPKPTVKLSKIILMNSKNTN